jgi:hypothetical protein
MRVASPLMLELIFIADAGGGSAQSDDGNAPCLTLILCLNQLFSCSSHLLLSVLAVSLLISRLAAGKMCRGRGAFGGLPVRFFPVLLAGTLLDNPLVMRAAFSVSRLPGNNGN